MQWELLRYAIKAVRAKTNIGIINLNTNGSKPQAVEELRSVARLAEGESPDALANDLPTRTALNYLRARQRLGAKFGLHVAGTKRPTPDNRVVNVVVSEGAAVLNEGAAVRFQVELQKQEDAWLVTPT